MRQIGVGNVEAAQLKKEMNRNSHSPNNRLLIIVPWDLHHIGGVNQVVLNLSLSLREFGLGVPLLMNSKFGTAKAEYAELPSNLPLVKLTLRNPWSPNHLWRGVFSFIARLPLTVYRLWRLMNREQIGAINVHYPSLSSITVVIAAKIIRPKKRIILSFHGADLKNISTNDALWRTTWRLILRGTDALVFCSAALASEFHDRFPDLHRKSHVIHNGVDMARVQQLADCGSPPAALTGYRFILNAATMEQKKGQDVLIKAFSSVSARYPDLHLVIMGRSAGARPMLLSLVAALELQGRVHIFEDVGHKDLLATLKLAQAFVLPSRIEPFGIVLLEAAAFLVPVVASRTGGIVEIVRNNESGFLVEPDNVDDLAASISRALDNRAEAQKLAQQLFDDAVLDFTWKKAAEKYHRLAMGRADFGESGLFED